MLAFWSDQKQVVKLLASVSLSWLTCMATGRLRCLVISGRFRGHLCSVFNWKTSDSRSLLKNIVFDTGNHYGILLQVCRRYTGKLSKLTGRNLSKNLVYDTGNHCGILLTACRRFSGKRSKLTGLASDRRNLSKNIVLRHQQPLRNNTSGFSASKLLICPTSDSRNLSKNVVEMTAEIFPRKFDITSGCSQTLSEKSLW